MSSIDNELDLEGILYKRYIMDLFMIKYDNTIYHIINFRVVSTVECSNKQWNVQYNVSRFKPNSDIFVFISKDNIVILSC